MRYLFFGFSISGEVMRLFIMIWSCIFVFSSFACLKFMEILSKNVIVQSMIAYFHFEYFGFVADRKSQDDSHICPFYRMPSSVATNPYYIFYLLYALLINLHQILAWHAAAAACRLSMRCYVIKAISIIDMLHRFQKPEGLGYLFCFL